MKKILYFTALCCLALSAGCTKESETYEPDTGLAADGKFYIVADVPAVETRASIGVSNGDQYEFSWDENDEIGAVIYDGTGYTLHKFTLKEGEENIFGTSTFNPDKNTEYTWYLFYPYREDFKVDDSEKSSAPIVTIPSVVNCTAGSTGHLEIPFYARMETSGFDSFYAVLQNPLALINVSVSNWTGEELSLTKLSLDGGLAGSFTLDYAAGALATPSVETGGFTATLEDSSVSDDETVSFYLACAPCDVKAPIKVTLSSDNGEYETMVEYPEDFRFEAGGVYTIDVECNPMAIKGSAVPDGLAELTVTVENESVYAWAGELKAGNMSIVLPEGEVKPTDGTFGKESGYTISSEYVYTIPEEGKYRVVMNTEKKTIVVYDPATDLKPFEVTWYKQDNKEKYPNGHTTVVTNKLWAIGNGGGWGAGKEITFTPSMADPQVLVYKGDKLGVIGGQTKFSIEANASFDAGGGDGVETFEQPAWFLGSYFDDTDGDGKHDKGDGSDSNPIKAMVKVGNNEGWIKMYGGYDMRECWWNFGIWPTTFIVDLRNMRLMAVEE